MSDKKFASDFGKIALWICESEEGSNLVSKGRVQILDEDGDVVREVTVYLYDNVNKKSDRSPDYYGWLKVPAKKDDDAPVKRGLTKKDTPKLDNDEEGSQEVAF